MADKKLESFKVGDLQRAGPPNTPVKPKNETAPSPEAEDPVSLGFARIEGILDNETPEQTRAKLAGLNQQLDAYAAKSNAKGKAATEKAKLAVHRTQELIEYLFSTKEAISAGLKDDK